MSKSEAIESADHLSSPTPDWSLVHFDVRCGRCGFDLFGQEDAVCPQCSLEFDWAHVVPLEQLTCHKCDYHLYGLSETRCPECGESFDWNNVLDQFRRRQKPLFEYHWRKKPFRSFLSSCWLAMRPWKLWRMVDIQDPPLTAGSVIFFGLLVGTYLFSGFVEAVTAATCYEVIMLNVTGGQMVSVGEYFYISSDGSNNLVSMTISVFNARHGWNLGVALLYWSLASFLSLMLLRQSMKQCCVRTAHISKLCIYAMVPVAMGTLFHFSLLFVSDVSIAIGTFLKWDNPYCLCSILNNMCNMIWLPVWLMTVTSIAMGLRCYIQMKHAWGVALVSQLIAWLIISCMGMDPSRLLFRFSLLFYP